MWTILLALFHPSFYLFRTHFIRRRFIRIVMTRHIKLNLLCLFFLLLCNWEIVFAFFIGLYLFRKLSRELSFLNLVPSLCKILNLLIRLMFRRMTHGFYMIWKLKLIHKRFSILFILFTIYLMKGLLVLLSFNFGSFFDQLKSFLKHIIIFIAVKGIEVISFDFIGIVFTIN